MQEHKKDLSTLSLSDELLASITPSLCTDDATYHDFLSRIHEGKLTRDENPQTHFGVNIFLITLSREEIFLVLHKKAGIWIPIGGHIDQGERLEQTVTRELQEEVNLTVPTVPQPFFFSTVTIDNPQRPCKKHFDVWFNIVSEKEITSDMKEFDEIGWFDYSKAKEIVTDPGTLQALERLSMSGK